MERVSQERDLTMGWCVNCHRTAQVEMKGNAYYDKLHSQLVKKYGKQRDAFFVQDIGGLECVKCHY
ncbi:MAG: cytochrome C, partial [Flavobacteriales bacterium]